MLPNATEKMPQPVRWLSGLILHVLAAAHSRFLLNRNARFCSLAGAVQLRGRPFSCVRCFDTVRGSTLLSWRRQRWGWRAGKGRKRPPPTVARLLSFDLLPQVSWRMDERKGQSAGNVHGSFPFPLDTVLVAPCLCVLIIKWVKRVLLIIWWDLCFFT